jgi:hypothetical protein
VECEAERSQPQTDGADAARTRSRGRDVGVGSATDRLSSFSLPLVSLSSCVFQWCRKLSLRSVSHLCSPPLSSTTVSSSRRMVSDLRVVAATVTRPSSCGTCVS